MYHTEQSRAVVLEWFLCIFYVNLTQEGSFIATGNAELMRAHTAYKSVLFGAPTTSVSSHLLEILV